MQCLLVAPLMMVLFLFSVDRHDGAFGRSYDRALSLLAKANVLSRQLPYTGKTFLSRQLSYTRSLFLLGAVKRRTMQIAVKRRTMQMVANGRFPHRFFLWMLKEPVFGGSFAEEVFVFEKIDKHWRRHT